MKFILTLISIVLFTTFIRAEITADYTIEWLSHKAEIIAFVTPISETKEKGPGSVWFLKTEFKINEIIKGVDYNDSVITVYNYIYNDTNSNLINDPTKPFLIFISIADNLFKEIDGRYVLSETNMLKSIFHPEIKIINIYTPEFKRLESFDELVERTRNQVEKERKFLLENEGGEVREGRIEVPYDSDIFMDVWAGSGSFLFVPDYLIIKN